MPRNASLSSHGPRGCTFRVSRAALLRLRLESRQFWADSGRSCRVKENNNLDLCLRAPAMPGPFLFPFCPSRWLLIPSTDDPGCRAFVCRIPPCHFPHLDGLFVEGRWRSRVKLTTENGSTWELRSKTVRLSPHTGHTVTVTGRVRTADLHGAKGKVKDEMKEHGMAKNSTEHGHLKVTNINMVSDSCKK